MKFSQLLSQREALLEQARLANLAFAYTNLDAIGQRIERARLRGSVCLKPALPTVESHGATLTAQEGSQSVIEEHFTDEEIMDLADTIAFTTGSSEPEWNFRLEELRRKFLEPVGRELTRAGIALEDETRALEESGQGNTGGSAQPDEGR